MRSGKVSFRRNGRLFGALALAVCGWAASAEQTFELAGQVIPEGKASVSLFGAITPFATATLTDEHGRFRITRLGAGQYTVAAFMPGYGEKRITIDIGPSSTREGRFDLTLRLDQGTAADQSRGKVSVAELSVPDRAWNRYRKALKRLEKHDSAGASALLKEAVEMAPHFTEAWNTLGTIAYQTKRYAEAEQYFRAGLAVESGAFSPLVNLGGVLLTLNKAEEAYGYNQRAVSMRPQDALANSQMGLNCFLLGKVEPAEKYLLEAQRLDPGHFSHPQLVLADIYFRRQEHRKAADELEDFLRWHPDWPAAASVRDAIAKLRAPTKRD